MARHRIIIDTDPGIDDILALLLALSASPEDLEVLLISLTYGNIDVENCLRNVVSLFHHVEKEREWRKSKGLPEGFDALDARKPIVAVGAVGPLAAQIILADYYHGIDGLGGIHHTHPHLSPEATWRHLFQSSQAADDDAIRDQNPPNLFIPSKRPAHEEILQILRDNPPDTITIVTIGPLTNAAHAAAVDPETFLRAKQVLTMGGAVELEGNMNPVAEFNIYADSIAAARVFALSSPKPLSTMPLVPPAKEAGVAEDPCLAAYPATLGRRLELKLFPLDITTTHNLTRQYWDKMMKQPLEDGSPLAHWMSAFLESTFRKAEELYHLRPEEVGLNLHDPLPIWYLLSEAAGGWTLSKPTDVRIETSGQWTKGMCVIDRRPRKRREEDDERGEIPGDSGDWLSWNSGNRVSIVKDSPGVDVAQQVLLRSILHGL